MPFIVGSTATPFINKATLALGIQQQGLADLCKTSLRSAQRWCTGRASPSCEQLLVLAAAVYEKDPALAESLATEAGTTLVAAGIVAPPPAPSPALLPAGPGPRPFPPVALMIDSILHAATLAAAPHAADPTSHDAVLAMTRAVFARARGLGLHVEEIDDALRAPRAAAKP